MKINLTSQDVKDILTVYFMDRFSIYSAKSIKVDSTGSSVIDICIRESLTMPKCIEENVPIKPGMMAEETGQTTQFPKANISTGENRQDSDFDPEAPYGRKKDGIPKKKPGRNSDTFEDSNDTQAEILTETSAETPAEKPQNRFGGGLFSKIDPDKKQDENTPQDTTESLVEVVSEEVIENLGLTGNRNPFADSDSEDNTSEESDPEFNDTNGLIPVDQKMNQKEEQLIPPKKKSLFNFDE